MYAMDFEYDSQFLSEYGCVVCSFESNKQLDVITGANIVFTKITRNRGRSFSLASTQYEQCMKTSFDICKNPDIFDNDGMIISNDEYRDLMRWLNRHEFLRFYVINDDERDICYYNASFNIEKICIGGVLYGLRLNMETDAPFGYGEKVIITHTFTDTKKPLNVFDISDSSGSTFPIVRVSIISDGDLTLRNTSEDCTTLIRNCKAGEIITIDSKNEIITSNYDSHDIANDFNYEFFRIGNTYKSRLNEIYASIECKIEIEYEPTIKDVL